MNNYLNIQSKIWLFGSYAFQGNPKALFLYMLKFFPERQCWWVADNEVQYGILKNYNLPTVLNHSKECNALFSQADVYVVENNREKFPDSMNRDIKILNLWHGVGIKPIEFGLDPESRLSDSIIRKHVRNTKIYKENMIFLATSFAMKEHFKKQINIDEENFIKGAYPRNIVYHSGDISTFDKDYANGRLLSNYSKIYLFAPTWRDKEYGYDFLKLLPDLAKIADILRKEDGLLIIKPHPLTVNDNSYQTVKELYHNDHNILFVEDEFDIYEIFNKIDVAIIDYSSIYYDLMSAGVDKFIRYIPDYELHMQKEPLVLDYLEYTDGPIAHNFQQLCELMQTSLAKGKMHDSLYDYFFGYSNGKGVDSADACYENIKSIIKQTDDFKVVPKLLPTLYSFDVFDTLVKRSTLSPISIFHKVKESLDKSSCQFPRYFVDNYVKIRRECESDVRDNFRKTTIERQSSKIEISYHLIFERMQSIYNLTDSQIEFLSTTEIEAEYSSVEVIPEKFEQVKRLISNGDKIILISDMYLPLENVKGILYRADPLLSTLPLYLSSEIGHQKSTGLLYKHIFFNIDYNFEQWIHHGDNRHADSTVPKRYGIKTLKHDMDSFIGLEQYLVNEPSSYGQFQLAAKMQRYRNSILKEADGEFDEAKYFGYAYFGSYIVPYLDWVINDALHKNYKKLYFISRDGYYLKAAADIIIANRKLDLKTEIIYASRRTWRLASSEENLHTEFFSSFGSFAAISTFREVVRASQFSRSRLLELVPELQMYSEKEKLSKEEIDVIASLLFNSTSYRNQLSLIKKDYRELVIQYLKQNIDFNESFAFVEFWGRGYAQDLMTDILIDAAEKDIKNPFYYVRCMRENTEYSIRHRFTTNPINFWFVEPIFATTPYKTVSEYESNDGIVSPCIVESLNEFYEPLMEGLMHFASDYSLLDIEDRDYLNRIISDLAYKYHRITPSDQFICNVFARFKDNTGPFQEVVETAPVLELNDLATKAFAELSRSIKISLARSSEEVREEYRKLAQNAGLRPVLPEQSKVMFPVNGLGNYSVNPNSQKLVYSLKSCRVFSDVRFAEVDKTDVLITRGQLLIADNIYSASGVPRFVISDGYITAHKNHACIISHIVFLDNCYLNDIDPDMSRFKYPVGQPLVVYSAFSDDDCISVNTDFGVIRIADSESVLLFSEGNLVNRKELRKLVVRNAEFESLDLSSSFVEQMYEINSISIDLDSKLTITTDLGECNYIPGAMLLANADVENYFHEYNDEVLVVRNAINVYEDLSLTCETNFKLTSSSIINPEGLIWTSKGIPVFKIPHGYVPALKDNFLFGFINGMNKINNFLRYSLLNHSEGKFNLQSKPSFRFVDESLNGSNVPASYVIINDTMTKISGFTNNSNYVNEGSNKEVYSDDNVNINLDLYAITESGLVEINDNSIFPCDDIIYYHLNAEGFKYISTTRNEIYIDKDCRLPAGISYAKGDVIKPQSLHWSALGCPTFKTDLGYIVARKKTLADVNEINTLNFLKNILTNVSVCIVQNVDVFRQDGTLINQKRLLKGTVLKVDDVVFNNGIIMLKTDAQQFIEYDNQKIVKCRPDIENYHVKLIDKKYETSKKLRVYKDLNFKEPTGEFYTKGKVFVPTDILWSDGGTPRFVVPEGFISTNVTFVRPKKFNFKSINLRLRKLLSDVK